MPCSLLRKPVAGSDFASPMQLQKVSSLAQLVFNGWLEAETGRTHTIEAWSLPLSLVISVLSEKQCQYQILARKKESSLQTITSCAKAAAI